MKKYSIDNLIIEVTRRCNLKCLHCLRGDAQDKDIDDKYIEGLFQKLEYISFLTITGGEPSLVPDKIRTIIRLAKKYKVGIGNFYIATNGIKVPDRFLFAILRLWTYCDDNEVTAVEISNDGYHNWRKVDDKILAFGFARMKFEQDGTKDFSLIQEGNAYLKLGKGRENPIHGFTVEDERIDGELYLNCKGNILSNCDLSYYRQDDEENIVVRNIARKRLDLGKACESFNPEEE